MIQMEWIWLSLVTVIGYLIGSINTAIIVGRIVAGDDIRSHGSGNAGATNALRSYGKKAAIFVLLGDCLKAVVSVVIAIIVANIVNVDQMIMIYGAGVAAAVGHNFPIFFGFKGGKGVLVSTVVMLFVDWRIGLVVFAIAIATMAISKYVSLGSVLGAALFFVLSVTFHFGEYVNLAFSFVLSGLVIIRHKENIKRLIAGTENKLGQKKSS